MRGAVPTPRRSPSLFRQARVLAGYALLALVSACSVYSSSLVDDSAAVTQGGSTAAAGKGASEAGKSPSEGGTSVTGPGGGGEGGEPDTGGAAGSGAVGGTDTAGTGNTAGGGGTAGIGGTSSTAGSSGTGGTVNLEDLLDGFEDNDLTLEQVSGRGGVWYTFHDKTTGTVTPSPLECTPLTADAPAELGMYAMHITATGFSEYGSGLGVDFRAGKKLYDASKYTGIRFWAKVGAGKNIRHRVQISDINTDAAGMECDPAGLPDSGTQCEDHFGSEQQFTTEWKQYTLEFAKLTQLGWGYPGAAPGGEDSKLDTTSLYGLQVTAKKNLAVDLWIDQIEFY